MAKKCLLTWLRPYSGAPPPPAATPFGRAALDLQKEGISVLIAAGPGSWMQANANAWEAISPQRVDAVYDRYSSRSLPEHYGALEAQVGRVPRGNPPELIRICTDKLATQRLLSDLPMPPVQTDPRAFEDQLDDWGRGYIKPRFGGLGRGIHPVSPGDPLPAWGPGAVRGGSEPTFLQKAILPPEKFGSLCVRWLAQREETGRWALLPAVARVSAQAVANVHLGAQALPAEDILPSQAMSEAASLVIETATRLQKSCNGPVIELGIDLLFDQNFKPWLLEVNSRPSGRLSALTQGDPARFGALAEEALRRPLRTLAAWS